MIGMAEAGEGAALDTEIGVEHVILHRLTPR